MKHWLKNQAAGRAGMTLVELMISLAIFGIVMGVIFGFLNGSRNSYADTRTRVHYQQSMRAVVSLLTQEIRSAGCDPLSVGFDKVAIADDVQLRCQMDLNGDGFLTGTSPDELVTYSFIAGTGTLSRDGGAGAQVILRNLTNVEFRYFDGTGNQLAAVPLNATDRALVRYVEIDFDGESAGGEPVRYSTRVLVRNG